MSKKNICKKLNESQYFEVEIRSLIIIYSGCKVNGSKRYARQEESKKVSILTLFDTFSPSRV